MNHDFWLSRWEENKIHGFHQSSINEHLIGSIGELALEKGDAVMVPLAGKSSDMLWLAEQGYRVVGIELSPVAVEAFFAENGLEADRRESGALVAYTSGPIRLLQGDIFDLRPGDIDGARALYDRAALIAFPPAMRERYAGHLASLLPPGSRMLLITLEYPEGEIEGPPFSVPDQSVHALFDEHFTVTLLATDDALDDEDNERFRKRGLTELVEKVYGLERMEDSRGTSL
jgi:thiopurine S-methyltransferase